MSAVYGVPDGGPGCYVEGSRGQYAIDKMAEVADGVLHYDNYYEELVSYQRNVVEHSDNEKDVNDAMDALVSLQDEMESALNEVAPDGFHWTWVDGELFYTEDDPEEWDE